MIGTLLNERYRLDAELGGGGMGTVYRAHDVLLDRPIAVKLVGEIGLDTKGRTRLLHEARAVAQLNHPNIVSVYDAGESEGRTFIVMELVEGESLHQRRPESLEEVLSIARQVCAALEHAHRHGIVHRDIKPENVLLSVDGLAKLSDFGLARSVASRLSREEGVTGTAFYLAPEQALGQEIDARTDLYALGVMLYELTTGRLPFTGDDLLTVISQHLHAPVIQPSTYNAQIPPSLDTLIGQLLSKRPQDRPASAGEVRQRLGQLHSIETVALPAGQLSLLDRLVRGRLVGRTEELAQAKGIWQRAISEESHVLLVSGEPGIGKTRFVNELATLVQVLEAQVLQGECYAEGGAPYAPLAQIIRQTLEPHSGQEALDLPDLVLADLLTLAPDLWSHYPQVQPNPSLDPQAEQQRLFESVISFLSTLIERAPLLLIVEDVHWADEGTLLLLRHLSRRGRQLPFLMTLTYREVELDQAHGLRDVLVELNRERAATRIKLGRLDREQTRDLLAVMFSSEIPDTFLDAIYHETEGNPFFIEEVCKALIEEGRISRQNGGWHLGDLKAIQVPQSVRLAIQARLSKLPEQAQDVLLLAAVFGREFDFATLREACHLGEEVLIDVLETAERAQLIREVQRAGREAFAFAHALIPSTLQESVSGLRRHRLHRRVAAAIEAVHPEDFEALAYHYVEAGDEERARTYLRRAADRARQVYANEEAIHLYSEALELMPPDHPDRFDLLSARASVYDVVACREEQLADVKEMLSLAQRAQEDARRCDALLALADVYIATELFRAREPVEKAVAIARALGDPVREGHALRRLGYYALHRLDLTKSRQTLEQATKRFQEAGLPGEAAACLHMLSLTLGTLGEHEAALQAVEKAVALSREAGDRRQEATGLRRIAIAYLKQYQYEQALPYAKSALALHRELGDRSEEVHGLNVLGLILAWLGQTEESELQIRRSLELAEAIDSKTGISNAIDNLIWTHFVWQGDLESALAFLDEQTAKAALTADEYWQVLLNLRKAQFLSRLGQYETALETLQENLPHVERLMGETKQRQVYSLIGCMEAELGRFEQAYRHTEATLEGLDELERSTATSDLLTQRAYVALLEGGKDNLELGLKYARQAIALLRGTEWVFNLADALQMAARLHLELGQVEEAWVISSGAMRLVTKWPYVSEERLFVHAQVLRASGRPEEADRCLRRAYERVMLVAGKIQDEDLRRSWLENVRVNREILAESARRLQRGG